MSWIFCNSITYSVFEPFEVLVEKSLFFEQHSAKVVLENEDTIFV